MINAIRFGHAPQTAQTQPLASNVRTLFGHAPAAQDSLQFGAARRNLLKEYGIDLDKVDIRFSKPGMKLAVPRYTALTKTVQAWEHARKNNLGGNESGRFYVTNAHMSNGVWGLGTNMELELANDKLLCGERSSAVVAFNRALESSPLSDFENEETRKDILEGMKVDFMVLSSGHKPLGEDMAAGSPCSECQSWIGTKRYFSPDTQIASLIKDPEKEGHWILRVNEVRDFQPLNDVQQASNSHNGVFFLPVEASANATEQLKAMGYKTPRDFMSRAQFMLNQAHAAFKAEKSDNLSGQRYAVAATFTGDDEIYKEVRYDLNPRWPAVVPELSVIAQGVRAGLAKQGSLDKTVTMEKSVEETHPKPKLQAIAYWSETPQPGAQIVGKMAQLQGGNPNALVVVVEDRKIKIRTLLDYQTEIYVSGGGTYGGVQRVTE